MDVYCSITIANYELIRLIRFVSQISTHLSKKIINIFYLILLNGKISFDVKELKKKLVEKLGCFIYSVLFI